MLRKLTVVCLVLLFATVSFAKEETIKTELLVVGSGIAGISAAAYASENGIQTVLIEKLPGLGGVMHFMEGTFAAGTKQQRKDMIGMDPDQAFKILMNYSAWKADSALVKRIVDNSAPTLEWLEARGIKFNGVIASEVDGNRVYHTFEVGRPGKFYADTMATLIKKNGGVILTETAAKSLITNSNGDVIGVMATNEDGDPIRIEAKAVLLATGSISSNKEMLLKAMPSLSPNVRNIGLKTNMGDGVVMGQAIGAEVANLDLMSFEGAVPSNVDYAELYDKKEILDAYMALKTQSLWLNKHGERFMNEEYSGDFSIVANALMSNGHTQITIFDEATKKDLMYGKGSHANYFIMYDKGQKLEHLDKAIEDGIKRGYAFKANSIEELAKQMQLDPKVVRASLDRYNELAAKGEDVDQGKSAKAMVPMTKGPYYAFKGENTICDGLGGLKINRNAQVMHVKGQPIKGLYAAGATSGGMNGANYPYVMSGFASAVALNTGRFAVEHAADTVINKKIKK